MADRIVAERFALIAREGGEPGSAIWRGRDLATSAPVRVVLASDPVAAERLGRAAALRHPTLLPLVASGRDRDEAYVVLPLVEGVTLAGRVAQAGRMRPATAAAFVLPLAEGIAAAHASDLAFAGLAADAIVVADGAVPWFADPPLAVATPAARGGDVRGLGALLALAVGAPDGVDEADRPDLSPRFIALARSLASSDPPSASEAAAALAHLVDAEAHAETSAPWEPFATPLTARREPPKPPSPRRPSRRLVVGIVLGAVALTGGVAVGAVVAQRDAGGDELAIPTMADETGPAITTITSPTTAEAEPTEATTSAVASPPSRVVALPISRIRAFDRAGDGENDADVRNAIDGSRQTAWSTEVYRTAEFGTKPGVGLIVDLALPADIRAVRVRSRPPGATVRIYLDRGPEPAGAPDGWTAAGPPTALTRPVTTIRVRRAPPATRVLVWISELPRRPTGGFAVEIVELEIRGVPAGA